MYGLFYLCIFCFLALLILFPKYMMGPKEPPIWAVHIATVFVPFFLLLTCVTLITVILDTITTILYLIRMGKGWMVLKRFFIGLAVGLLMFITLSYLHTGGWASATYLSWPIACPLVAVLTLFKGERKYE